jgi:hypothetical protein
MDLWVHYHLVSLRHQVVLAFLQFYESIRPSGLFTPPHKFTLTDSSGCISLTLAPLAQVNGNSVIDVKIASTAS